MITVTPGAPEEFPSHLQRAAMLWGDGKFVSLGSLIWPLGSSDRQLKVGLTQGNSKVFSYSPQHHTEKAEGGSPALPRGLDAA